MANKLSAPTQTAFIGLGANLGDARASLANAARLIGQLPDTRLVCVSSLYRSAPIESSGPDYLNAVAQIETSLTPQALLSELQGIERVHGRERPYVNAPRTLDLDILSYGQVTQPDPSLTLPHPRAHLRAFVLQPWAELMPDLSLPGIGSIQALAGSVTDQAIERQLAPDAWFDAQTHI